MVEFEVPNTLCTSGICTYTTIDFGFCFVKNKTSLYYHFPDIILTIVHRPSVSIHSMHFRETDAPIEKQF